MLTGIDPETFRGVGDFQTRHPAPLRHGQAHDIGQVILPLRILRAHPGQGLEQERRVDDVGAGVHFTDGALGTSGIRFLHHLEDVALGVPDHAAIAAGLGQIRTQEGQGGLFLFMTGQQPLHGRSTQQRRVRVQDEAMLARGFPVGHQRSLGLLYRMPRTQLVGLQGHVKRLEFRFGLVQKRQDPVGLVSDDHHHARIRDPSGQRNHVPEQGPPGHGV